MLRLFQNEAFRKPKFNYSLDFFDIWETEHFLHLILSYMSEDKFVYVNLVCFVVGCV